MRKRDILIGIATVVLAFVAWSAAWRYDEVALPQTGFGGYTVMVRRNVRTHLVTGEVQILLPSGWTPLDLTKRP